MKVTIQLDDDLFEAYQKMGTGSIQSTTKVIENQLKRFAHVTPQERAVILVGEDRLAVEKVFQTSLSSGKELADRVTRLARFQIGDVVRYFTEGELITLTEQAGFHGQSPEAYARMVAEDVLGRAFNRI